jgi:hypothetical protein
LNNYMHRNNYIFQVRCWSCKGMAHSDCNAMISCLNCTQKICYACVNTCRGCNELDPA